MSYAAEHASAYADVLAAGGGTTKTFTRSSPGTEQADGTFAGGSDTSIICAAFAKRGNADRYAKLGLSHALALTLFVSPQLATLRAHTDEFVRAGDTLPWNGASFTVKDVGPLTALDGYVICGEIVLAVAG
jgi:hypothetical protein